MLFTYCISRQYAAPRGCRQETATMPEFQTRFLLRRPNLPLAEAWALLDGPEPAIDDLVEDRKSTRLNSSHVRSSYAVFCLKKKKYINDVITSIHRQLLRL